MAPPFISEVTASSKLYLLYDVYGFNYLYLYYIKTFIINIIIITAIRLLADCYVHQLWLLGVWTSIRLIMDMSPGWTL